MSYVHIYVRHICKTYMFVRHPYILYANRRIVRVLLRRTAIHIYLFQRTVRIRLIQNKNMYVK